MEFIIMELCQAEDVILLREATASRELGSDQHFWWFDSNMPQADMVQKHSF